MVQINYGRPMPEAHVSINKNRQRVYENPTGEKAVFLKHGDEIQIEFYNPTSNSVLAKIKLNGNAISDKGIVLRPGERVWLDRYFDSNKKFLFETYAVDNTKSTQAAIASNGLLEISFYNEKIVTSPYWTLTSNSGTGTIYPSGNTFTTHHPLYRSSGSTNTAYFSSSLSTPTCSYSASIDYSPSENTISSSLLDMTPLMDISETTKSMETGRVGKGRTSNQQFTQVDTEFESFVSSTVIYKLLPESQRSAIYAGDIRKHCTGCGKRITKDTWKFCPSCGEKL